MENSNSIKRVCVFCGSSSGAGQIYTDIAQKLGKAIVSYGMELVYGGGSVGLMGVIANAVLQENGIVIGVIPHALSLKEIAHQYLTELRFVASMHERKATMAELSDAFIAMPGGFGTLDELFEIVTWAQLGLHTKPIGLLNVDNYFDLLLTFINHALQERFIKQKYHQLIITSNDPEDLLGKLIHCKRKQQFPEAIRWEET